MIAVRLSPVLEATLANKDAIANDINRLKHNVVKIEK